MIHNIQYGSSSSQSSTSATKYTRTLRSTNWSSNVYEVEIEGVTEDSIVFAGAAPNSIAEFNECGVYCSSYYEDTVVFRCTEVPEGNIKVNIFVAEGGEKGEEEPLALVSWGGGTDEEIGAMIDAAHQGRIDLSDYWAVGDVRTITVSAFTGGNSVSHEQQDIDIVIAQFGDYNSCGSVLQFDFKDELATGQRYDASSNAYGTSEVKTETLPALANALPSWLKNRLKEFDVLVASNGNGSITTVTGNKLALRSEVEIFGSTTYSKAGEGSQIDYYKTSANRAKKRGHNGSIDDWWERSPVRDRSDYACIVYYNGTVTQYYVYVGPGLAPFGCL